MVQAYYYDNDDSKDCRLPHMTEPAKYLTLNELYALTGVQYFKFDADTWETCEKYAELKKKRGYSYEDCIEIVRDTLPDYDEKLKIFFKEHIHADEEIRFIIGGSGYFDLRDKEDKWVRVAMEKGDLIIVPAGIYHRFTLDTNDYIKAKRLFVGTPVWTPINRPEADSHPVHQDFLKTLTAA